MIHNIIKTQSWSCAIKVATQRAGSCEKMKNIFFKSSSKWKCCVAQILSGTVAFEQASPLALRVSVNSWNIAGELILESNSRTPVWMQQSPRQSEQRNILIVMNFWKTYFGHFFATPRTLRCYLYCTASALCFDYVMNYIMKNYHPLGIFQNFLMTSSVFQY